MGDVLALILLLLLVHAVLLIYWKGMAYIRSKSSKDTDGSGGS